MSLIPSIDSLLKEKNTKVNTKNDIYNGVLKICIEKIIYANRHTEKTYIIFEVPKILISQPMYDMKSCILFLINNLSAHNYIVDYIEPYYLYIDWGCAKKNKNKNIYYQLPKSKDPEKLKLQTQALLKKHPGISDIEFVYENEKLILL